MRKSELKKKWFKYCDTDKLVDDTIELLTKYGYRSSEHGVCVMLDTYFTNKEPLIKMFINSKNYVGNMRIVTEQEFDREIDDGAVRRFIDQLSIIVPLNEMLRTVDENGKTIEDYMRTGVNAFSVESLPNSEQQKEKIKCVKMFDYGTLATIASIQTQREFLDYLNVFRRTYSSRILESFPKNSLIVKGTKTSRALNKVCEHYGICKLGPKQTVVESYGQTVEKTVYPYDQWFAKYADSVSELKRKMYFIISLNPLDYLTMSVGTGWNSCHHIQHGSYKAGCQSYMLDSTSMITFVTENIDGNIHEIPKVYRQMYHYSDNWFIQNRLYPQGNDGATDLYAKFRNFVIAEFTDLLGSKGNWNVEHTAASRHNSFGRHYRDYNHNPSCCVFYPTDKKQLRNTDIMNIGHNGICVLCGGEHTNSSYFCHAYRSECIDY